MLFRPFIICTKLVGVIARALKKKLWLGSTLEGTFLNGTSHEGEHGKLVSIHAGPGTLLVYTETVIPPMTRLFVFFFFFQRSDMEQPGHPRHPLFP